MFTNNNRKIIHLLAWRSFNANRRRNLIAVFTIALAMCVMLVLSIGLTGTAMLARQKVVGDTQAYIHGITDEQYEQVRNHPELVNVSAQLQLGKTQQGDSTIYAAYLTDNHHYYNSESASFAGRYPQNYSEVVVKQTMLQYYGLPAEIGQELPLDLGYGLENFTVCGLLLNQDESREFWVYTSKEYAEAHVAPLKYTVRINLLDTEQIGPEQTKQRLVEIASELGLGEQFMLNDGYFSGVELNSSTIILILLLSAAVVFACGIVIYSMFYISISARIQEYGRLKVIGTTTRMLRRIVRLESVYLSIAGILLGNLVGAALGYLIQPDGWNWTISLVCMVIISFAVALAVRISTWKPMRMAGKVSPIEAVRASPYNDYGGPAAAKQLHRSLSPRGIAWISFQRNPRKVMLVFCSLGFAGILLISVATIQKSVTPEHIARADFYDGDYVYSLNLHEESKPQMDNPLSVELEQAIRSLDGVIDVLHINAVKAEVEFPAKLEPVVFTGLSREDTEAYADLLKEGTLDYEELSRQNGVLIASSDKSKFKNWWSFEAEVGDRVPVRCSDGSVTELTIMGILSSAPRNVLGGSLMYAPDTLLPLLDGGIQNYTTAFVVQVNEDSEEIRQQIYSRANGTSIMVSSLKDREAILTPEYQSMAYIVYAITFFLLVFSLINLLNTLVTNLINLQREYGVFQSIGMTNTQLKQTLGMECLIFIIGAVALAGIGGIGIGALLCSVANGFLGGVSYRFPFLVFAVYTLLMFATYLVYRAFSIRICTRRPLVERIRD